MQTSNTKQKQKTKISIIAGLIVKMLKTFGSNRKFKGAGEMTQW